MDSISSEVAFKFRHLRSDVDEPKQSWQLLLRVLADFTILIDGWEFYVENEFPIVEFAAHAVKWLRDDKGDFLFVSMESEEEPLLGFYLQEDGTFSFYSPHQLRFKNTVINRSVLQAALAGFIAELKAATRSELSLDIEASIGTVK